MTQIGASVICMDPLNLGRDVDEVAHLGVDFLHIDVMDGGRVPRYGLYPELVKAISHKTSVALDAHLMVVDPKHAIEEFSSVGLDSISFHVEDNAFNALRLIDQIRLIATPGIVINVGASPALVDEIIREGEIKLVTLMGTHAGLRQPVRLRTEALVRAALRLYGSFAGLQVQVDGGVTFETAPILATAGVDRLICGSATLYSPSADVATNYQTLRSLLCTSS